MPVSVLRVSGPEEIELKKKKNLTVVSVGTGRRLLTVAEPV